LVYETSELARVAVVRRVHVAGTPQPRNVIGFTVVLLPRLEPLLVDNVSHEVETLRLLAGEENLDPRARYQLRGDVSSRTG